jgi:hypothetical protein
MLWVSVRRYRDALDTLAQRLEDVGALEPSDRGRAVGVFWYLFGWMSRDDLRARLRQARPAGGVPILTEATAMIASYLTAERELGRIAADADVDTLAPTLIGAGHLLFAGREGTPPEPGAVRKVVTTVIAGVLAEPVHRLP